MQTSIPWVEKYRPVKFEDVILNACNKRLMNNILERNNFPNLLLYGPPGTGKTTSIINIIQAWQEKHNEKNKGFLIHLNASDERGIDVIRNQINQFVNSYGLHIGGTKFVILDEVDYMTKNAQQALRHILQDVIPNVRFCLMCNYISRIDRALQNEFIILRFNKLPQDKIIKFLVNIAESEKLKLSRDQLLYIQDLYKSDIRSMINFMQSNNMISHRKFKIIKTDIWISLLELCNKRAPVANIRKKISRISITYNIPQQYVIYKFVNYLMREQIELVTGEFLRSIENYYHAESDNYNNFIHGMIYVLIYYLGADNV
jgi:DNA polymerase III delta prime subunit